MITQVNIRKKFIEFFAEHNHMCLESASLVPEDDHSLLLVNSGMAPLKKFFLNESMPQYPNLVTIQKCVRAGGKHNDLEEVGFTKRHHTFFEMCGNFSFGGYSNEVAIRLAWSFLTKTLNIDKNRLYVTVHPDDQSSCDIWSNIISDKSKIHKLAANEWSMGTDGPCGKCTEIFYDNGSHLEGDFESGDRYLEIWNIVIMSEEIKNGIKTSLQPICIDTGAGLERLNAVCEGVDDNYKTSLFKSIITKIGGTADIVSYRVIADHARAVVFMMSDGVLPGVNGREYVLRRIIRRAIFYEIKLEKTDLLFEAAKEVINLMCEDYPEILHHKQLILENIAAEASQFRNNCIAGINQFEKMTDDISDTIPADIIFKLYDTYGLQLETIQDAAGAKGLQIDKDGFDKLMQEYRNASKVKKIHTYNTKTSTESLVYEYNPKDNYTATILEVGDNYIICDKTVFYPEGGGQESDTGQIIGIDDSWVFTINNVIKSGEVIVHKGDFFIENNIIANDLPVENNHIKNNIDFKALVGSKCKLIVNHERRLALTQHHSASHILLSVLRKYFGDSTIQQGSLIKENSLRLDFLGQKISSDILQNIERDVNLLIQENVPTWIKHMSRKEAKKINAVAAFGERYTDNVRVVSVCDNPELCCGTHVKSSGQIGLFMIINECSIGVGIRRINAVVGMEAIRELNKIRSQNAILSQKNIDLSVKIKKLESTNKQSVRELISKVIHDIKINYIIYNNGNKTNIFKDIENSIKECDLVFVINKDDKQISCYLKSIKLNAKDILLSMLEKYNGKCGGNEDFAQGGCAVPDLNKFIAHCFEKLDELLRM